MTAMFRSFSVISLMLVILWAIPASADSLWKNANGSLYTGTRSTRVGDLITIYITESTSASQEAGTKTSKSSEIGAKYSDVWDSITSSLTGTDYNNDFNGQKVSSRKMELGGNDQYNGMGQTSRTSKVKTVVTAVVTEILDNGNLYVVGEHKVKVNDELETVRISGVVRPDDISAQNAVFSYQVAQVEVSVKGVGVVGSKQTPGVLSKLLNWLF